MFDAMGNAMDETLFFEAVKEHRGEYFVEYQPPVADLDFATINLVFPNTVEPGKVAELMESELRRWLARYPVPLMVTAFDAGENLIRVKDNDEGSHLVGWSVPTTGEVVRSWHIGDLTEFLKTAPPHLDWRRIYTDVPFRTDSQIKTDAYKHVHEQRRRILVLKIVFALWLAVIPAGGAIFMYLGPEWLGLVALIFPLWKAWRTWLKISGKAAPSVVEAEKAEKQRKMEHYYYHCERNPSGFSILKAQNFENDLREKTQIEAAQLAEAARHPTKTKL